ncbi:hypothetical protein ACM26V_16800 [Salipaludibacillus sp. HK11]|uniref:hypothetical protein n=1 Tax=Salipaludibacillus sp. HK11 TaxID=3394320 RepID=UPI0039FD0653
MKKAQSFRLEEEQVKQLDKLVDYYRLNYQDADFAVRISKAEVLQHLIKQKFNELNNDGKL